MRTYDVAVIGAGPVGSLTALAHAQRGAKVLLVEKNPKSANRLAGEWLHPPAAEAMAAVGLDIPEAAKRHRTGEGFAVFPDDGSSAIVLPYADGKRGFSCEHADLVGHIRGAASDHPDVDYRPYTRVAEIAGQSVVIEARGASGSERIGAGTIVGADGRASVARKALDLATEHHTISRMAGLLVDCDLPFEGHGHVFLGGPGPILAYRIAPGIVRMCIDVPLRVGGGAKGLAFLWDGYAHVLPEALRRPFREALLAKRLTWAANQVRPRTSYGRKGLTLVGDAVGHYHPLTAVGMTLGFADAVALPKARTFRGYELDRKRLARVPEMLAVVLYEVFADPSDETVAIRRAVYDLWRAHPEECERTMRYLAGQDRNVLHFSSSFGRAVRLALGRLAKSGRDSGHWAHAWDVTKQLTQRMRWLMGSMLYLSDPTDTPTAKIGRYERGLKAQAPGAPVVELPRRAGGSQVEALKAAVASLTEAQAEDGSWEGEVVWCPMLPAQYTLMAWVTGQELDATRRRRLLLQFERTRLEHGVWGLHEHAPPNLFVTTLVYVASRLLGVSADDPMLADARRLFAQGNGVVAIPSWGKLWLALVGLYDWRGVNAVMPELWALPRALPMHPSRYYCHTRNIYMGMAAVYGMKLQGPITAEIEALRTELFPGGFDGVDWAAARDDLREGDLYSRPGLRLRLSYKAMAVAEKLHVPAFRRRMLDTLAERIRYELRVTDHTSLSPVNGMLNLLTLWARDPSDPDYRRGLQQFEGWIFEDDVDGLRIAGARSATWDSAFAVQALTAAAPHVDCDEAIAKGVGFLETQQIRESFPDFAAMDRSDPKGGFCFAGVWHGWPVSDCTAEAIEALMGAAPLNGRGDVLGEDRMVDAARFIMRAQNPDGGFGSYEARRTGQLEWMNPAEMFGDSMTEMSYTECTASCTAALAKFRERYPTRLVGEVDRAIDRAEARLRARQRPDGSWEGSWGVNFIYGTMFGIRGLRAAGVPATDPAITKACAWLLERQRGDGGWGEDHAGCVTGEYTEATHSQVIQTSWALMGLLEADAPDWDAIDAGAAYLASRLGDDGHFPREEMAGIFFRTALLEYALYRRFFPVWALGMVETRRARRLDAGREATRVAGRAG